MSAAVLREAFAAFGLTVTVRRGKAEVVCSFHGRGAVVAKRKLYVDGSGNIGYDHAMNLHDEVAVVQQYRHMGSLFAPHRLVLK